MPIGDGSNWRLGPVAPLSRKLVPIPTLQGIIMPSTRFGVEKKVIYTNQFHLRGIHVKAYTNPDGTIDHGVLCINRSFTYGTDMQAKYLQMVRRYISKGKP